MKALENSRYLGKADLAKIESKEGAPGADAKMPYVFSLTVTTKKTAEADAQGPEVTAASPTTEAGAEKAAAAKPADLGEQLNNAASKLTPKPAAEQTPAEEKKP